MVKELRIRNQDLGTGKIETIYFGGGTPSLLNISDLRLLIDEVYKNYKVVENPEITLESNPDDLTYKYLEDISHTSINRLSIGIQSFFDEDLNNMNRAHSAKEAKACLQNALEQFDNITIDLIYGIPSMSIGKWQDNLDVAFSYEVPHISSYALTVEPKTALDNFIKKGKYAKMDEALALEHFNCLVEQTERQGYVQYEISNFGKPNYFSKHNTSYWQGKHYLGIGPSAHSFDGVSRSWNVANNTKYIKSINEGNLPLTREILTMSDCFNEYIMTGLRTMWGVSTHKIESEFGREYLTHLLSTSRNFIDKNLLVIETSNNDRVLKTTKKARFLIDGIASDLFMI